MSKSTLEARFLQAWRIYGNGIEPVREYMFAKNVGRRWRFDFAFPYQDGRKGGVAVECDGGQWAYKGGRHATDKDRDKLNHAACSGWRVLRFSGAMLDDPENVCRMVRWALDAQPCGHPRSAIRGEGVTHWCGMCAGET